MRYLGGKVTFNGEDLLSKNVAERSQAGLFLSFQNPIDKLLVSHLVIL